MALAMLAVLLADLTGKSGWLTVPGLRGHWALMLKPGRLKRSFALLSAVRSWLRVFLPQQPHVLPRTSHAEGELFVSCGKWEPTVQLQDQNH